MSKPDDIEARRRELLNDLMEIEEGFDAEEHNKIEDDDEVPLIKRKRNSCTIFWRE